MFERSLGQNRHVRAALGLVLGALFATAATADPPDWAPAHGRRGKHHHDDEGAVYVAPQPAPVVIEPRYGVINGHCNRQALGTVLGGVAGGVVGNQVSGGDAAATAIGTLVGALLGNAAGRSMDNTDRACTQQVLQYAQNGRPVQWVNGATTYVVTPGAIVAGNGRECRPFTVLAQANGQQWQEQRRACRGRDMNWYVDN